MGTLKPGAAWGARFAILGGLLALVLGACGSKATTGCKTGERFCYCKAGTSCTQDCGAAPGCALQCSNANGVCALHGGDECNAACQGSQECRVSCGQRSMVACQAVARRCEATVGEGSRVHCAGEGFCDIACAGSCDVDCLGGHCRVKCAPGATCNLTCDKAGGEGSACADPRVKVCGASC